MAGKIGMLTIRGMESQLPMYSAGMREELSDRLGTLAPRFALEEGYCADVLEPRALGCHRFFLRSLRDLPARPLPGLGLFLAPLTAAAAETCFTNCRVTSSAGKNDSTTSSSRVTSPVAPNTARLLNHVRT
jgi:hypothetical protein